MLRTYRFFMMMIIFLFIGSTMMNFTVHAAKIQKVEDLEDVPSYLAPAVQYVLDREAPTWDRKHFGTYENVTRGDAAALIASALRLNLSQNPHHGFTDVDARSNKYVRALKASGYMHGISSTHFGTDQDITRGEIALIVSRIYQLKGDPTRLTFRDVAPQYRLAVAALQQHGITNGFSKTIYGTDRTIKRGDFTQFLYRLRTLHSKKAPHLTGITLMSATELHLHFDHLIERIPERAIEMQGFRRSDKNSTVAETKLTSQRHFTTTVRGKTIVLKAEEQYFFKTGFDRAFDIRIEADSFTSLGTDQWNRALRIENIDDTMYEDYSKTRLQAVDRARPALVYARAQFEDRYVDVQFTEPIILRGNHGTIGRSFYMWNSSNNGYGIDAHKVEDFIDRLTITFPNNIATDQLDMNKIRLRYDAQSTNSIVDVAGNQATNNTLIGIHEVRKR